MRRLALVCVGFVPAVTALEGASLTTPWSKLYTCVDTSLIETFVWAREVVGVKHTPEAKMQGAVEGKDKDDSKHNFAECFFTFDVAWMLSALLICATTMFQLTSNLNADLRDGYERFKVNGGIVRLVFLFVLFLSLVCRTVWLFLVEQHGVATRGSKDVPGGGNSTATFVDRIMQKCELDESLSDCDPDLHGPFTSVTFVSNRCGTSIAAERYPAQIGCCADGFPRCRLAVLTNFVAFMIFMYMWLRSVKGGVTFGTTVLGSVFLVLCVAYAAGIILTFTEGKVDPTQSYKGWLPFEITVIATALASLILAVAFVLIGKRKISQVRLAFNMY
jgi:hypothetical protein